MCWDKATCWDYDAGVPKYMNRDPPCKSQRIVGVMNDVLNLRDLENKCQDHQFFTIVDDAVQERDLQLYLDITPPFNNWKSYCTQNGMPTILWQTECLHHPEIYINGYMSFETNFEWRHFDDSRLDYVGTFNHPFNASNFNTTYSTFSGTELNSKFLLTI